MQSNFLLAGLDDGLEASLCTVSVGTRLVFSSWILSDVESEEVKANIAVIRD